MYIYGIKTKENNSIRYEKKLHMKRILKYQTTYLRTICCLYYFDVFNTLILSLRT